MTFKDVKILDCTFRDGGHLLGWNFKKSTVEKVISEISLSGIDYFEIGYRSDLSKENTSLGGYAFCLENDLEEIKRKTKIHNLTVMMDVGKVTKNNFSLKKDSSIDSVRVATYGDTIDLAIEHVVDLHEKGYEVFLNLMALTHIPNNNFIKILKKVESIKPIIKAFYFADSFGSMFPNSVKNTIKIIKDNSDVDIGFHGHNNLQMAFPNALAAMEEGVNYIDSTLYGQGRGAGNLPTEIICSFLNATNNNNKYDLNKLIKVIQDIFLGCTDKVNWGYSLDSFLTGINNIHPEYLAELKKRKISLVESNGILQELNQLEGLETKYDKTKIDRFFQN